MSGTVDLAMVTFAAPVVPGSPVIVKCMVCPEKLVSESGASLSMLQLSLSPPPHFSFSGDLTVIVTVAWWIIEPLVPVIVTVYVPGEASWMLRVDVPDVSIVVLLSSVSI